MFSRLQLLPLGNPLNKNRLNRFRVSVADPTLPTRSATIATTTLVLASNSLSCSPQPSYQYLLYPGPTESQTFTTIFIRGLGAQK